MMLFCSENSILKKIITVGGQELIVLSPFLDSLGNFAFKNIDLAPGIPKT